MADATPAIDTATALAGAIARHVPITILAEAVERLRLDPDFAHRRKQAPADPTSARLKLARHAVAMAVAAGAAAELAGELASRLHLDGEAFAQLAAFAYEDSVDDAAKQAALARRANTMALDRLGENLEHWKAWVCVVAIELPAGVVRGTGILVGPDLVLTAWHTVKKHAIARRMVALFDHRRGAPVTDLDALDKTVRQVSFHQEWHVDSCVDLKGEGLLPDPDPMSAEMLTLREQSLDFALLRLAEPIGKQARDLSVGGVQRGWLRLEPPSGVLSQDDRIIIPQHPGGHPQRIDFGRFAAALSQLDASRTRLRYTAEAEPGSSGAPCFNQKFTMVGMHNAAVLQDGVPIANQAIRLEVILAKLKPDARRLLAAESLKEPPPIWSTSEDPAAPRVILGRTALIKWIKAAETEMPAERAVRIYAVAPKVLGPDGSKGFGKSFSIEILRAARRGAGEHLVVLGAPEALLPATAPDVIAAIAVQLGIPPDELATMPPRPSLETAGGISGDKLSLWASVELPAWFDGVLARRRQWTRNLLDEARAEIRLHELRGEPIPHPLREQAQSGGTLTMTRWKHVWFVLDRLGEGNISDEVRNFLAGLTGSNLPEASVRPELRRLRWLFLGLVPDFLGDGVTVELLDPMALAAEECVAPMKRMTAALGRVLDDSYVEGLRDMWETNLAPGPPFDDPHRRLALVQGRLVSYVKLVERSALQTPPEGSGP